MTPRTTMPTDALIEFRCDCGSLIGWVAPVGDRLRMTLWERPSGLARPVEGSYWLPDDLHGLVTIGEQAACKKGHSRLISGAAWTLPGVGDGRRKVICSA